MSSEIRGSSPIDRIAIPPTRSSGSGEATPSRAVVRVTPIDPRVQTETPFQPLGRSGLDLHELLSTLDLVTPRTPSGNVALDVGLENARSALLRNLPGDALAALDGVWDAAVKTEEGWYLRSGALTVLGLPGESDRVADAGLAQRPASMALRFVQALSRLALGDGSGAAATLSQALQRMPTHPTLLVLQALVLVRQRDQKGAQDILAHVQQLSPDHPALTWGRNAMRVAVADVTRQQSRPTPVDWPAGIPGPSGGYEAVPSAEAVPTESSARSSTDVATGALERFGGRIATASSDDVAREARMLLRAFSAGGTLAASSSADQAHAARVILIAFAGVAAREVNETTSPVRQLVAQLFPLLQAQDGESAERLIRKNSILAREPMGRMLMAIVRGAVQNPRNPPADIFGQVRATPDSSAAIGRDVSSTPMGVGIVRDELDRGPIVPIRLGLALLEETAASRRAASGAHAALAAGVAAGAVLGTPRHGVEFVSSLSGSGAAIRNVETSGQGWGAANAASLARRTTDWSDGAGVRAVALICVVMAAFTLLTGHGAVAIGLAVGAAWLGLRRSGRDERNRDGRGPDHSEHAGPGDGPSGNASENSHGTSAHR